jgi:DNA-binding CsgD family transcriptional regulator
MNDTLEPVVFIYKRHAALASVKDLAQMQRNILTELNRCGLNDYCFGSVKSKNVFKSSLGTIPSDFADFYQDKNYFKDDQVLSYLLTNDVPKFRSTIEDFIDSAPMETDLIRRNRDISSAWKTHGYFDSYLIPINSEDGTVFMISSKYEDPQSIRRKIEHHKDELIALGKAIRHVCLRKFSDIISVKDTGTPPLTITKRPLDVLRALANGCPTVYTVAAEMGISINTVNHHIATAKVSLRASSLPHAVAIAIREGLL